MTAAQSRPTNPLPWCPWLLVFVCWAAPAHGQFASTDTIPRALMYSGRLHQGGVAVNASRSITVRLYDGPGGAATLLNPPGYTQNVSITNGVFSLEVPVDDAIASRGVVFLEIDVAGTTLTGRQKLLPALNAIGSAHAVSASNPANQLIQQIVPAGAVLAFSGETVPAGWVLADGLSYAKSAYPGLYAALSGRTSPPQCIYGEDATTFNLPDYRGQFLRGWDGGRNHDPQAGLRNLRGDGRQGDLVGTTQGDQFGSHDHGGRPHTNGCTVWHGTGGWECVGPPRAAMSRGGVETRPKNISVKYIIRCGPNDGPCPRP